MSINVSVIIPCFNVEEFVEQCLESVVRQHFDGLEVIAIDDASTDGTWARLQKYESLDFVRLLRLDQNVGLGAVRNMGIDLSRGEYLLFLDSDDWLVDGALQILRPFTQESKADLVYFDYVKVHQYLGSVPSPHAELFESFPERVLGHADKIALLDFPTMAWLKLYRKEFVTDSGILFGRGHYEDVSWTYTLTVLANRVQMLSEVLYCYRQRKGSILNKQDGRHLDLLSEYDKVFAHCEKLGDEEYRRKIIAKAVAHYVFILFIRSDRLSWPDLKAFFVQAHEQLARFDRAEVESATAGLAGSPIKRQVLLSGSVFLYLLTFGAAKVSRLIKSPVFLYKAYSSRRR